MSPIDISDLLKNGGPYAIAALALCALAFIFILWRKEAIRWEGKVDAMREDYEQRLEAFVERTIAVQNEKNAQIVEMTRTLTSAIVQNENTMQQLSKLVEKLVDARRV